MNNVHKILIAMMIGVWCMPAAHAQQTSEAKRLGRAEALGASSALVFSALRHASQTSTIQQEQSPRDPLAEQSRIEARLGLELYALGEDWRAVSALQRYQLLAKTRQSAFLANLIIGQIYDRNARSSLAELGFEQAVQAAPDRESRLWSALLETQQVCIRQDAWVACSLRLDDLDAQLQDGDVAPIRDTLWMQRAVAATMLRKPWPSEDIPASFSEQAQSLARAHAAFDSLPTRRPGLAMGLSAILPGAGQLYNRRWGDALIAFGLNALFASATYYSFAELESVPLGVGSALFFSGFYVGNLVNAKQGVDRHNALIYKGYYEGVKQDHWPEVTFRVTQDQVSFGTK